MQGDTVRCRIYHWQFFVRDGAYLDEEKQQCDVRTYPACVVGQEEQASLDH